ncbi:hypothetical protein [Halorussus salinus]|uniref:hypothetical protein n=1 Tax=Halorussus salinus TaxID=1364935 RepID=UPI0010932CE4|nr:hypothetical protein [Halorussus salinus]
MTGDRWRRVASGLLALGVTALYFRLDPFALLPDALATFAVFVPLSFGLYAVKGPPWRSRLGSSVAIAVGLTVAEFV